VEDEPPRLTWWCRWLPSTNGTPRPSNSPTVSIRCGRERPSRSSRPRPRHPPPARRPRPLSGQVGRLGPGNRALKNPFAARLVQRVRLQRGVLLANQCHRPPFCPSILMSDNPLTKNITGHCQTWPTKDASTAARDGLWGRNWLPDEEPSDHKAASCRGVLSSGGPGRFMRRIAYKSCLEARCTWGGRPDDLVQSSSEDDSRSGRLQLQVASNSPLPTALHRLCA
jgi:hypothetical protein